MFVFSYQNVSAQCSGRYFDEVFPGFINYFGGNPIPISNVGATVYGSAPDYQGTPTTLDMYVFEPDGDTAAVRPLIIFAFGGSFTAGAKESPDVITLCDYFVKRGYVTVSIKYRIGANPIDSINMLKAVVRGVHDAKAAIRFFYKDAATTNTYRIDTNNIFMGGVSAGGLIGIHLGYMNDTIGVPNWIKQIITDLTPSGNLEGESGNPGYSTKIRGIIGLSACIGDTAWMDVTDPPMVSLHGTNDGTVPYGTDIIVVSGTDIITVDGSATMKIRADNIGLKNNFFTWPGADHVPFVNEVFSASQPYMDTTTRFIRNFLYEIMTGNVCDLYSGIADNTVSTKWNIYPNPSSGYVNIERKESSSEPWNIEVYNSFGQIVSSAYNIREQRHIINKNETAHGLYFVKIFSDSKETTESRKVVFE